LAEAFKAAMERIGAERGEVGSTRGVEAARARLDVPAGVPIPSPGLALALVGVLLAFWAGLMVHGRLEEVSSGERLSSEGGAPGESTVDLGELAPAVPLVPMQESSEAKAIGQGQPPKPFPGQFSPDAKGQCPARKQVPINGGCWLEIPASDAEECEQNGSVFFKSRCYAPAMDTRRKPQPSSSPPR
jgi:hypothetical protein